MQIFENPLPYDTITVSAVEETELAADHTDLFVVVRGSSLVTGHAALSKAREVAQLVRDLQSVEITEDDIQLQSVHADVSTGALGTKSSSASYTLKITCRPLSRFADVLGVITGQKNTTVQYTIWGYPENAYDEAAHQERCIQQANEKARRVVAALGVRLLGVASYTETLIDPESSPHHAQNELSYAMGRAKTRTMTAEDLGMEVTHTKSISFRVDVVYRVSGFETAPTD